MKTNMEYFTLQNPESTVKVPKLIYGTAWKQEKTAEYVAQAINSGFRGIDTAAQPRHYNEQGVGDGLEKIKVNIKRDELFIQTKFSPIHAQDPATTPYDNHAPLPTQVEQSFNSSLKNLGTDYLDSLVMHAPFATVAETMVAWQAMEKIYATGKIKILGISNCYSLDFLKNIYQSATVKPKIIQNRFCKETGYDKAIRNWCIEKNIIYQSFWTLTANPNLLEHIATSIAKFYSKTAAQVLFRFLTQINIAPLTGTCSSTHMQEDLDIFNFRLSKQHIEEINSYL